MATPSCPVARAVGAAILLLSLSQGDLRAASITGWNTANVDVGPAGTSGASTVYDRDVTGGVAGAVTNGRIAYDFPEADSPGIKTVTGPFNAGGNMTAGCIMASSGATCDSPFQSGKRFKQQITGTGPTDLVFDLSDIDIQDGPQGFQVFQKLINQTGDPLLGFKVTLGFGVGDSFVASTVGDGLSFEPSFQFGPDKLPVYAQFPFGLFGPAAENDNFNIDGFFAAERAGMRMIFAEDMLVSDGLFGPYGGMFGHWMSQDDVPTGAFWDHDADPTTDAILMAWLTGEGKWELRREIVGGDPASLAVPITFDTLADVEAALMVALLEGEIEDLSNMNVTYSIALGAGPLGFSNFTLRLEAAAVPLPATLPLLLAAFAGAAALRARRAAPVLTA